MPGVVASRNVFSLSALHNQYALYVGNSGADRLNSLQRVQTAISGTLLTRAVLNSGPSFLLGLYKGTIRSLFRDKWVPATTAWRFLRMRLEEWPSIWRVDANIFSQQSRTPTRGVPSDWELGEVLKSPHRKKITILLIIHNCLDLYRSLVQ